MKSIVPVLVLCGLAQAQTFVNVPYAGGSPAQVLDVYLPPGPIPPTGFPAVVWIHGGGWSGGDKSSAAARVPDLNNRGIAVVSINYRLTGEAIFPAQIHDCKGAIRFVRAHAGTLGINPFRIGVWGSSAGGHLAALVATSGNNPALEGNVGGNLLLPSDVRVAADYYGPTDILTIQADVTNPPGSILNHNDPNSPESHLVGWDDPGQGIGDILANLNNPTPPYPGLVTLCEWVSPMTWLDANDPPTFIGHGTADTSVPIMQSVRLRDALLGEGVPFMFRAVEGFGHGDLGEAVESAAVNFLATHLGVCYADCEHDQDLDVFDLLCFQQRYALHTLYADCEADGDFDVFDFLCFQAAYAAGCQFP